MALIHCPECNKEISDTSEYCISCGYNLFIHNESLRLDNEIEVKIRQFESQLKKPAQIKDMSDMYEYRSIEIFFHLCLAISVGFLIFGLYVIFDGQVTGVILILLSILLLLLYFKQMRKYKEKFRQKQEEIQYRIDNFEQEKQERIEAYTRMLEREKQKALDKLRTKEPAPVGRSITGIHCPMCHSRSFSKISTLDRTVSIGLTGLASGKIGKQYKCKKCGHMW